MKYFLDTEFKEQPSTIDLISIGIVSEDGRTFYAENSGFDTCNFDDWLMENVKPHLRWICDDDAMSGMVLQEAGFEANNCTEMFGKPSQIGKEIITFVGKDESPEWYGYYSSYDWVVFCWLFGRMIDLPDNFPMYCRDIKQMMDEKGNPEKPPQVDGEHDALADAYYHRKLYNWISTYEQDKR